MRGATLIDAGPLLTAISARDEQHAALASMAKDIRLPVVTCWPVLTEVAWLLQRHGGRASRVFDLLEAGVVNVEPLRREDWDPIRTLLARYADLGLQLADACLLQLSDRLQTDAVLTFDRRDFSVARTPTGRSLRILPDHT